LGGWQSNATVTANSRLGFGEQLYVYLGGSKSNVIESIDGSLLVYGSGMIVPVGTEVKVINPEATRTLSTTPVQGGSPASNGYFERFALRASYPLIKTRSQTLEIRAGIERVEQVLEATEFSTPLSRDLTWVIRAGADWSKSINSTVSTDIGVMYSNGIAGRSPADAASQKIPLSQQGAGPIFEKIGGTAQATAKLPHSSQLHVFGSGQFSFGAPLLKSEKFSLDGAQILSTFESGALTVDAGAALRSEITHNIEGLGLPLGLQLEPYLFLAAGIGRNEQPSQVEPSTIHAHAEGIGVRAMATSLPSVTSAKVELELSHASADVLGLAGIWKVAVSTSVAF
jgi:hemolysin activation/secretion protein